MNLKNFNNETTYHVVRKIVFTLFATVSTLLFFWLNKVQPNYYIDEIFHIPQTMRYCDGNFREWDEKITTFPGLYLIAFAILSPFNLCSTIFLRGVNLVATFSNFLVINELLNLISKNDKNVKSNKNKKANKSGNKIEWIGLTNGLNIALLPPLYFLLFLFYTDVISTNMVLLMYMFYLKKMLKTSAIFGVFAVLLRQTNIVWVAWMAIEILMDILENKNGKSIEKISKNDSSYVRLLWKIVKDEVKRGKSTILIFEILKSLIPFIIIGLSFVTFVFFNKGIVLGDRNAHVATVHLPQIFYYSIFVCFFSWPYVLTFVNDYFNLIKKRPFLFCSIFTMMLIIVHKNTLVHPYLLADNRHFTFYVWNRTIARNYLVKYFLTPIYTFCIYSLWRGINHLRLLSIISYFVSIILVFVPQLLLEPRYFFIPYIIWRINLKDLKYWQISSEFITIFLINCFQFYIFKNKVFYWHDDVNPQRISW